jgi:4-hydroxy-3-polyprenylbenzoate decarboxylase
MLYELMTLNPPFLANNLPQLAHRVRTCEPAPVPGSAGYSAELCALADVHYQSTDIGAAISSGSFRTLGMLVAPCSIRTLGEISTGVTSSLLSRAADVVLKERRRLVLLVRETPLHAGHLQSMLNVTQAGAVVMPPVPAFYAKPETVQDIVDQTVGRALDLFGLDSGIQRWGEA